MLTQSTSSKSIGRHRASPSCPSFTPTPHFPTLVDPTSASMGSCVKDKPRKTIDRFDVEGDAVMPCAARGSRMAPRDRVEACKRVQCVQLVVPRVERTRPIFVVRCGVGRSLHRRGKKFQPVRARRAFKKVVFLSISIDCPHICSPRPFPPPLSFAAAVAHGSCPWFG